MEQMDLEAEYRVVGSIPELGNWDPEQGVKLKLMHNHVVGWVTVTPGVEFEYKYIKRYGDEPWIWEEGDNWRCVSPPDGKPQMASYHRFPPKG